jgi:hypothetical membrane protein
MNLQRLGILCGILAPLLWLSLIGIAGAIRTHFSHATQYISELGERGSPTETMMRYAAFEFTGFLYLCFAPATLSTFRYRWISTLGASLIFLEEIGRIGAGIFPCDPGCNGFSYSQHLHYVSATVGFVSGILATITWGIFFWREDWRPKMAWYSIGTGTLALIFFCPCPGFETL